MDNVNTGAFKLFCPVDVLLLVHGPETGVADFREQIVLDNADRADADDCPAEDGNDIADVGHAGEACEDGHQRTDNISDLLIRKLGHKGVECQCGTVNGRVCGCPACNDYGTDTGHAEYGVGNSARIEYGKRGAQNSCCRCAHDRNRYPCEEVTDKHADGGDIAVLIVLCEAEQTHIVAAHVPCKVAQPSEAGNMCDGVRLGIRVAAADVAVEDVPDISKGVDLHAGSLCNLRERYNSADEEDRDHPGYTGGRELCAGVKAVCRNDGNDNAENDNNDRETDVCRVPLVLDRNVGGLTDRGTGNTDTGRRKRDTAKAPY